MRARWYIAIYDVCHTASMDVCVRVRSDRRHYTTDVGPKMESYRQLHKYNGLVQRYVPRVCSHRPSGLACISMMRDTQITDTAIARIYAHYYLREASLQSAAILCHPVRLAQGRSC